MAARKLLLNTVSNARKTLARLIREMHASEGKEQDVSRFRALAYAIRLLLDFFTAERDGELLERLAKIEERLSERTTEKAS